MTILGQFRHSRRLIRSVFALFVLAWLQAMAVPCVMARESAATEVVDHSAGHSALMSHHMSGMDAGTHAAGETVATDMSDCVYCPHSASDQSQTDSNLRSCAYPHESRLTGSTHQLQIEQFVLQMALIDSSPFSFVVSVDGAVPPPRYLVVPISQRSLNLTHCIQLK